MIVDPKAALTTECQAAGDTRLSSTYRGRTVSESLREPIRLRVSLLFQGAGFAGARPGCGRRTRRPRRSRPDSEDMKEPRPPDNSRFRSPVAASRSLKRRYAIEQARTLTRRPLTRCGWLSGGRGSCGRCCFGAQMGHTTVSARSKRRQRFATGQPPDLRKCRSAGGARPPVAVPFQRVNWRSPQGGGGVALCIPRPVRKQLGVMGSMTAGEGRGRARTDRGRRQAH